MRRIPSAVFGSVLCLCLCLLVLAPWLPAQSLDAVDLGRAVVHDSPADVASWPITSSITRIDMAPGADGGLTLTFADRNIWPNYQVPGWAIGGEGLQYTVWAGVNVGGQWHIAGFIQMWRSRVSTGAAILAHWNDWAYDPNRWGPMAGHQPAVGEQMIFFATAGNARDVTTVTSVRARTNAVMVALPAGDTGSFTFNDTPTPQPQPQPQPQPGPTIDPARVTALEQQYQELLVALDQQRAAIRELQDRPEPVIPVIPPQPKAWRGQAKIFGAGVTIVVDTPIY